MDKCDLGLWLVDFDRVTCDGCGRNVKQGEQMITGIESCCGGGC